MISICQYKPRHGVFDGSKPHTLVKRELSHGGYGMFPPVQEHYQAVGFDRKILDKLGILTVSGWVFSCKENIRKRNVRRFFNQFTKKLGFHPKKIKEWLL